MKFPGFSNSQPQFVQPDRSQNTVKGDQEAIESKRKDEEIDKAIDFKNNRNSKMAFTLIATGIASFICLALIAFNPALQAMVLNSELASTLPIIFAGISGASTIGAMFVSTSGINKNPDKTSDDIFDGINNSKKLNERSTENEAHLKKDGQNSLSGLSPQNASSRQDSWINRVNGSSNGGSGKERSH